MGSVLFEMEFKVLKGLTQFPFGLLIAQHVTEDVLCNELIRRTKEEEDGKLNFVRGIKLIGLQEMERRTIRGVLNGFLATFDSGKQVWSQYVIGADGSKSSVSYKVNISRYSMG